MLRTNEALHDRVRRWLDSGALFAAPQEARTRVASGALCVVCSAPILREEVEYEVLAAGRRTVSTHRRCYLIWRQESRGRV